MSRHLTPSAIEQESMRIISTELDKIGIRIPEEELPVVKRVIHTTADFDYAQNLVFTENAVGKASLAVKSGCDFITDTNMALSGISKKALEKLGCRAHCFMADKATYERAEREGTTRAVASIRHAAELFPEGIYVIGNAPTALFELKEQVEKGLRPSLVVAVPVGFVNVVEAKEEILSICQEKDIACIAAMGRKGGSTVAAAICNAIIYSASDMLNPKNRGWN